MERLIIENNILFDRTVGLLKEGRKVIIPVKGGSMMPLLRSDADTVELEGVEAGSPEGGERISALEQDIVLFQYNGHYILHRILRFEGDEAVIQGDGNLKITERCSRDRIFGRAVTVFKKNGRVIDPRSKRSLRLFRLWFFLSPVRRYILGVIRRVWRG